MKALGPKLSSSALSKHDNEEYSRNTTMTKEAAGDLSFQEASTRNP